MIDFISEYGKERKVSKRKESQQAAEKIVNYLIRLGIDLKDESEKYGDTIYDIDSIIEEEYSKFVLEAEKAFDDLEELEIETGRQ